jgi:ABC-type transport system involved in Fe-S cluster assembly fused permease/ATPase subunit
MTLFLFSFKNDVDNLFLKLIIINIVLFLLFTIEKLAWTNIFRKNLTETEVQSISSI